MIILSKQECYLLIPSNERKEPDMIKKNKSYLHVICYAIFMIYLLFLMKIVLFKYIGLVDVVKEIATGNLMGFRSINLIPLTSIIEFSKIILEGDFTRGFNNIIGNIFIFAPLGYFLPLLFNKCKRINMVILVGFIISFLFETCQYLMYLGSADIDDIILNLIGTVIGFAFYQIIIRLVKEKKTIKYTMTIIFSIIGFVAAGYLAIDDFGIMFGIQNEHDLPDDPPASVDKSQIQVHPNDKFDDGSQIKIDPKDRFDIEGVITSIDNKSVTINMAMVTEFEAGKSVAVTDQVEPNLITIHLLSDTKYSTKDIYDMNGNKVKTRSATKDDLQMDQHIMIKGYKKKNEFFATKIIINNFKF